jgi:hypothetical protein
MKMIEFDVATTIQAASLAAAIVFGLVALFYYVRKRQQITASSHTPEVDGVIELGGEGLTRLVFYAPESTLKQIRGFGFTVKPKAPRELIRRVEGKEE